MESIKTNNDKCETIILKASAAFHPSHIEQIRNNVIQQLKDGVVVIPIGFEIEILRRGRMIDVDMWIDKLAKIVSDPEAPGEYKDYCMHFISEIETEFRAQEVQAMQEGEADD